MPFAAGLEFEPHPLLLRESRSTAGPDETTTVQLHRTILSRDPEHNKYTRACLICIFRHRTFCVHLPPCALVSSFLVEVVACVVSREGPCCCAYLLLTSFIYPRSGRPFHGKARTSSHTGLGGRMEPSRTTTSGSQQSTASGCNETSQGQRSAAINVLDNDECARAQRAFCDAFVGASHGALEKRAHTLLAVIASRCPC